MTGDRETRQAWDRLAAELNRWRPGDATFWWRDDDAYEPTTHLDRLLSVGSQPLGLAVIPQWAKPELLPRLAGRAIDVLQHGFAHENHEPPNGAKGELGPARPAALVLSDLDEGWRRLESLFGSQAIRVVVPPWNLIAESVADRLAVQGYLGFSTFGPRPFRQGTRQVNTHVDIVDWKRDRAFIGTATAVDLVVAHLAARRLDQADRHEPTGILSHHRDMADAGFEFLREFFAETSKFPAVRWLAASEVFQDRPR